MRARREPKNKAKKENTFEKNTCGFLGKGTTSPQHVFFHVFAQTTHVVTTPHGFACVGILATWLYRLGLFQVSSKSVQGFRSTRGSKYGLSHYFDYWLLQ